MPRTQHLGDGAGAYGIVGKTITKLAYWSSGILHNNDLNKAVSWLVGSARLLTRIMRETPSRERGDGRANGLPRVS